MNRERERQREEREERERDRTVAYCSNSTARNLEIDEMCAPC